MPRDTEAEHKIEKGVPIPPKVHGGGQSRKYPFYDMEVGDSVFLALASVKLISGSLSHARKVMGGRFTSRTVDGGVRVWRIA